MRRTIPLVLIATLALCGKAQAHPHVWVTIKSEVVFAPDGAATEVRHHWTFDEMFSTFAIQGMDSKKAGGLTRQDLAPLAEVNVTSLKDFEFFTFAKADGKKSAAFNDPKDYWLEHKEGALTLHFTLPFKTPVKAKQLDLEVYDTSYFVDFKLQKEPASLVGAPAHCKIAAQGAGEAAAAPQLNESFFQNLSPGSNFGQQFANRISVACP